MAKFIVIDKKTGQRVTTDDLVRENPGWIQELTFVRPNELEFALGEDGELYLLDACGNYVSVMNNFEVVFL